jgi:phosphoglycerate dehydrogenase-like enzyme
MKREDAMKIVFYGRDTEAFADEFPGLLSESAEIAVLPDDLAGATDRGVFATADVIVANRFSGSVPNPRGLKLLHVPAAGFDTIDMDAVPAGAAVCNSFGHEQAIAEFVLAALLARVVPLADADARLRRGDWSYWAGAPERAHGELSEMTLGLFGFGHIGRTIARRAKAFDMTVVVANRSAVPASPLVDGAFALGDAAFWSAADAIVASLPLTEGTRGIVGKAEFAAMRPDAVILNVGRGPVIDEQALYDALTSGQIGGAVIDTWYHYPTGDEASVLPASLPFHELRNVVMTPHMSGWTRGTIRRRRDLIARNVNHLAAGEPLENVVRPALG